MGVLKVKVISLPYIFQVLCFTRPQYQVSVYRTIGPLVFIFVAMCDPMYKLETIYGLCLLLLASGNLSELWVMTRNSQITVSRASLLFLKRFADNVRMKMV